MHAYCKLWRLPPLRRPSLPNLYQICKLTSVTEFRAKDPAGGLKYCCKIHQEMHLSRVVWIWKAKWDNYFTSQHMYESIQIRVNRDPNGTVLLLFQPSCTQPRSLYCITSNIKYVIIKECKQKDDLVNYTESATQSLSVYSVQYTLHHELLSSHLCTNWSCD